MFVVLIALLLDVSGMTDGLTPADSLELVYSRRR
jgi:hypothetical protein